MSNLAWKQPVDNKSDVSDQKIIESECGNYRVVESTIRYGEPLTSFYAMIKTYKKNGVEFWDIIHRHRAENAAILTCEKHKRDLEKSEKECIGGKTS